MSKHTSGPWSVSRNAYGTVFVHGGETLTTAVGTEYRELVAGGNSHDTLTFENAVLISAAPDLLTALNCVPTDVDYGSYDEFVSALGHWWSEMALPAINKAEGRS